MSRRRARIRALIELLDLGIQPMMTSCVLLCGQDIEPSLDWMRGEPKDYDLIQVVRETAPQGPRRWLALPRELMKRRAEMDSSKMAAAVPSTRAS